LESLARGGDEVLDELVYKLDQAEAYPDCRNFAAKDLEDRGLEELRAVRQLMVEECEAYKNSVFIADSKLSTLGAESIGGIPLDICCEIVVANLCQV